MPDAQLGEEGVDGADLHPVAATRIPQLGCLEVVRSVGHKERQRPESLDDRVTGLGSTESLKQLLQH